MRISSVSSNQAFNGSIRVQQYSMYGELLKREDFITNENSNNLLKRVLNAYTPIPNKEPKFLVKGQADMLNKCIGFITGTCPRIDLESPMWLKNLGKNIFEFRQIGKPHSLDIKFFLNA